MTMLELVKHLNFAVVVLFTLLYLYQGFYVVVGLVRRRWQDRHQPSRLHRFAVIVSARNEEGVIGELLESLNRSITGSLKLTYLSNRSSALRKGTYPSSLKGKNWMGRSSKGGKSFRKR